MEATKKKVVEESNSYLVEFVEEKEVKEAAENYSLNQMNVGEDTVSFPPI